jgi:hypothetical protein
MHYASALRAAARSEGEPGDAIDTVSTAARRLPSGRRLYRCAIVRVAATSVSSWAVVV